jgi:hypothetical protein
MTGLLFFVDEFLPFLATQASGGNEKNPRITYKMVVA